MAQLKFFFSADGSDVGYAVDAKDSVQVIDFVLEKFGEVAGFAGLHFVPGGMNVLIANRDFLVAFHLHKNGEETEAGVPDDYFLIAAGNDLRINERPRLGAGELQENNASRNSKLRSGDAAAIASFGTPVSEGVAEIVEQAREIG